MLKRLGFVNQNEKKEVDKKVSIRQKLCSSVKKSKNESEQPIIIRPKTAASDRFRSILSTESNGRPKTSHQKKKPENNKSVTFEEKSRFHASKFMPMLETIYEEIPNESVKFQTDKLKNFKPNIETSQKKVDSNIGNSKQSKSDKKSMAQRAVTDIIKDFEMREKKGSKKFV
ncbi:hypothetical protein PVAND_008731 [Polypedilum vanderplanki]|uniref:Uncharacterized protein n=1 Tax=Polypedilum vanderplanki TaxID=319348 RepID=A0A9J6CBM6_POLVA|nr:hypothetical protein PVAND_008731 [Polypedilum vanderplanki]